MRRIFGTIPPRLALLMGIAAAVLVNVLLLSNATAHPASDDDPSVRVAVLKSDDGAVRVSVQILGADGEWGERLLPTKRVISTESPTNTWLRSSPVTIDSGGELNPLFCVVAHGAVDDPFWVKFRAFLYQSARSSDTNLRFETHLRGDNQAAAINRCIADGAAVIASTLASPEDVREPLKKAKAAGIRVVTFNAGVEHAEALGSEIHIALNDRAAGELAGRHFNQRGITGQVGCVIHEQDNLSLERRCDGLEDSYQGAGVTRIQLEEDASLHGHDHSNLSETLANVLSQQHGSDYGAILTLNADILDHALTAVQQLGGAADGLRIASVGVNLEDLAAFPADHLDQHLDLLISDSVDAQGHFVAAAMQFSYRLHYAEYISQPQLWLADPSLVDHQAARSNVDALESIAGSLDQMLNRATETERHTDGIKVRVAALKRADGSVVFAIESMGPDGRWSSRQLPNRRVLTAEAPGRR